MHPELFKIPWIGIPIQSYGFMLMVGFLTAIWFAMRRAERVKANPDLILNIGFVALLCGVGGARAFYVAHYWSTDFAPKPNLFLAVLDITAGGLEYYGGLLCAIGGIVVYLRFFHKFRAPGDDPKARPQRRPSVRLYLDILAPAAMWGLAFGRMGCFLNGCCWGGLCVDENNKAALPWAVTFPYGSSAHIRQWENRQAQVPAELIYTDARHSTSAFLVGRDLLMMSPEMRDGPVRAYEELAERLKKAREAEPDSEEVKGLSARLAKMRPGAAEHDRKTAPLRWALQYPSREDPSRRITVSELRDIAAECRSLPVHPAQVYGIINAFLLSWVLSLLFYLRQRHGIVIAVMMVLYPITRVILETVRVDNPHDTGGLTISQAVSVGVVLTGIALLILLHRLPLRSPRAVAFVLPPEEAKGEGGEDKSS